MRRFLLITLVVSCLAVGFAACAPIGITRDPAGNLVVDPAGGPIGAVARSLGFGWIVDIGLAGVGVVLALKAKKWKQAAVTTLAGVEAFAETDQGRPIADDLKAKLAQHHVAGKVYSFVKTALDAQGINKDAKVPAPEPTT